MAPFIISRMVEYLRGEGHDIRLTSTTIEGFLAKLKASNIPVTVEALGVFISGETGLHAGPRFLDGLGPPKPCPAGHARLFLEHFPLRELHRHDPRARSSYDPALVLLPLMRWKQTNPDRLKIVRMLLEDDDGGGPCWSWSRIHLSWRPRPLHVAAAAGDFDMVELLVELGAAADVTAINIDATAEMARKKGYLKIAELLKSGRKQPAKSLTAGGRPGKIKAATAEVPGKAPVNDEVQKNAGKNSKLRVGHAVGRQKGGAESKITKRTGRIGSRAAKK